MKNYLLMGTKRGYQDFAEAIISDTHRFDKIIEDIKWAAEKKYHHMQLYTYDEQNPDEMKLLRNIN